MIKRSFAFSVLVLIGMLSACAPVYHSEYSFVPPKSDISKMCTAQCVQGRNACYQNCRMNNENCVLRAKQTAMFEYKQYEQEQNRMNLPLYKNLSSFDRSSSCNSSCDCEPTYRSCFSACGGEVLEQKRCVAFCDKK